MSRQDRFSWFAARQRRRKSSRRYQSRIASPRARRLHVEALEDRRMLAVITVDSLLDNFDPGAPSTDGMITLREAILAANTNSVVGDAPAGSGADTIDFSVTGSINLTFGELGITNDLMINGPGASQLTIDAGGSSRIFDIDDGSNFSNDVVAISGLTLTGGNATGEGGAIRSREGLTLSDLVVTGNTASGNGGGIDARSGSNFAGNYATSIIDTVVSNNSTTDNDAEGGGIFVITSSGSTTTISGSTISGNDTSGSNAEGAGIFVSNFGTTNISLSTISGNSSTGASSAGGGIYVVTGNGGVTTISQSTISSNSTYGSSADGGGIYVITDSGGMTTISGSTVSGNSTNSTSSNADGGGIFVFDQGTTTVTSSTISGNASSGDGGGIAISTSSGNTTIKYSTIAFNTANPNFFTGKGGGGLFVSVGTLTLDHSIVADNTDTSGDAPEIFGTVAATFFLIGDDTGATITDNGGNQIGTSGSPIDPLLGVLSDNGGPTQTHVLLVGSPAVDTGDPSIVFNPAEFDQRGTPFVRVFDDPAVLGAGIDMGAYERQTLAPAFLVVTTAVDELDYANADVSLREAIKSANGSVGADTITFDAALFATPQTITLNGTDLEITEAVTIDATALPQNVTVDAQQLSRIFNITATSGNFTLAGLTLTGGRTTGDNVFPETTFSGGAIRSLTAGNLTIDQSTVSGNSTTGDFADGGGIYSSGTVTLTSSSVSGNSTTGSFARGGGIFSIGDITLTSSTVSGNSTMGSSSDGGGIYSFGAITLNSSSVNGNSTTGTGAQGGGILSFGVTLTSSTVSGNSTTGDFAYGGGILSFGAVTLTSSTVSGNSTAGSNADGGGIRASGDITLTSSTVTNNYVTYSNSLGGGIWNNNDTITITNSIVAGNTAGGGPDIDPGSGALNVDFSLIGDNAGTGLVEAQTADANGNLIGSAAGAGIIDPLLGPLANNGGATETHALLAGSPAIDAGDPNAVAGVGNVPLFDQRGAPLPRVFGTSIDMGAIEQLSDVFVVDTAIDESDGDFSPGDLSLREALEITNAKPGTDTIMFDATFFATPQTITLGGTELVITEAVTIDATALAQNVTVDAQQLSRIFNITATSGNFTLAGLTLTGGLTTGDNANSSDTTFSGGAIRSLTTGSLTLDQSTVSGNGTEGRIAQGGGIFSLGAVTLTGSTVSGNSTAGSVAVGGGIRSISAVTLTSSTVSGNSTMGSLSDGGGILSIGVTLTSSTVSGNSTTGDSAYGGGILSFGAVTLTSSTVSGNSTAGSSARGGGIFASDNITLTNSSVSGNSTAGSNANGGGIFSRSPVTLISSTVTDNYVTYSNSTGGGIWNDNDTITITNSIVAGNTAGGGSPDIRPGTGALNVDFSLIGDNADTTLVEAQTADASGNLIGSAAGAGIIDPLLGPLANNGGATETHTLLAGSPAIDGGDPAAVAGIGNVPLQDQRGAGYPRVFGAAIDIGTIEQLPDVFVVDTAIDESDGDFSPGDLSLREALEITNSKPGSDTIMFDATFFATPQTITLGSTELVITEELTIDATTLLQNVTVDAQQLSRIFNITATSGNFTLAGLTLTGGLTTGDNANSSDTTFSGGAIRSLTTGSLTLDQSTVSGNSTTGSFANGGGIFSVGAVTLTGSTVSGNSTTGDFAAAGGIYSVGAVTLTGSTVSGNSTAGSNAQGGGIFSLGTVTLTSSTVSGNSTAGDFAIGGGIRSAFGAVTLTSSTVSGNSTAGSNATGGGIRTRGTVTLISSTVTNNDAMYSNATGGGIWNDDDTITITNSIVAGNTAGGGSPDIEPGTGVLNVDFSLIGDNAGTALLEAQTPDANGNLIGSAAGAGIIDPLLGSLANNGGATETHALLAGSPALDAGDPNIIFNPEEFDQRGAPFVRVFDDPAAFGAGIDMGAYERQTLAASFFVVTTTTDELDYTNAEVSLREAINSANGSIGADTITFDVALSGQTITLGGTELVITEAVTIDATALAQNVTVDAQQLSRIFNITATSGDFMLAGLTLSGGLTTGDNSNSSDTTFSGGAIRSLTTGNLTIDQSTVSGNGTTGSFAVGGGIRALGDITLTSSTVSGNSTAGGFANGGGIFSLGTVTLTSSTVSGNSTTGDFADSGGVRASTITLTSSTVSGNGTAGFAARGGGIFSLGTVTLTSSTVNGNSTTGSSAVGGGIRAFGDITLTSSTVSGNGTAGDFANGGGIFSNGAVMLTNSTVSGNSTMGDSADGGGIFTLGTVTLTSSTITDNDAVYSNATGGGIWNDDDTITITNSIVAGNTTGGGSPDIEPGTGALNVDFSLIEQLGLPLVGIGNITGVSANLGPLANNGGPTQTHALLAGSPAIDAGDPSIVFNPAEFDQRGIPFVRVFDDPAALGAGIDMGAYERQTLAPAFFVVTTTTDELDYTNAEVSLREAINSANGSVGADTITFDVALSGQTITLGGTELVITEAVTIDATALAQNVTVDAQQLSRIFNITATSGDFMLAGLTLSGGRTTGNNANTGESTFNGGAIRLLTTGSLAIDQSTVSGNSTAGFNADGGGIFSFGAVTLTSSTVSGNSTTGGFARGGGILSVGEVTLTGSTVSGNSTTGGNSGSGGIFSYGSVTLSGSTVSGNSTAGDTAEGGGIRSNGAVTLTSSTVSGNSTAGMSASGGGIRSAGDVTLTDSTVSGNSTAGGFANGGGIFSVGAITLTSSTVSGNSTAGTSANGGGVWNYTAPLVITGSIVAGNTASGSSPDLRPGSGTLDVDYSLIGDTSDLTVGQLADINAGAGNLLDVDPMIASLADNGGPTLTHALLAGSPAIDAGDPAILFDAAEFDQRGDPFTRVDSSGSTIDIGAFELQTLIAPSANFDGSGFVTGLDFLAWQLGFGTPAPTAAKTDGDADNDGDVDGVDLGFWESQFGQSAPLFALSSLSASGQANEEPLLASVAVAAPAPLRSASQQAAASIEVVPVSVAPKPLVTFATPTSAELASVAQIASGFSSSVLRESGFVSYLNIAGEHLSETNGFAKYIDLAFERAWDDFDSLAHERSDSIRIIANRDEGGHLKSHAQVADDLFATLAEDEGVAGLRPPL